MLLQEIWKKKYNWDSRLRENHQQKWRTIAYDLNQVMMKSMPRPFYKSSDTDSVQDLHVFVDASMTSYSAAAYICNGLKCTLVMAKTRVAPLKRITPPRLES